MIRLALPSCYVLRGARPPPWVSILVIKQFVQIIIAGVLYNVNTCSSFEVRDVTVAIFSSSAALLFPLLIGVVELIRHLTFET